MTDIKTDRYTLLLGDCLERLKELPDNSVDALVTDPPAGISLLGATWDSDKGGSKQWINWLSSVLTEVKRVMKPGAHGFVWALPRTAHWTGTAIEWAGLEIRDVVHHIFGSGFPKNKSLGDGLGTALKPAVEDWILIRKPISEKSISENLRRWGTGALNIELSRIGTAGGPARSEQTDTKTATGWTTGHDVVELDKGRWPSNLILDEEAAEMIGAPSRYFYTAKPSVWERDVGLGDLPKGLARCNMINSNGQGDQRLDGKPIPMRRNIHPSVKPFALMRYLIRMITPCNKCVLDPFLGSGTTGAVSVACGFTFVGIEKEEQYMRIAAARIKDVRAP